MIWVSTVVQGILLGGLYALFACGLSLMLGVMKVINLAHGDLAVLAAYVALGVVAIVTIPALYSFVLVVPIFAVAGYFIQRTLIQASLWGLVVDHLNIRIFPVGYWLWPAGAGRHKRLTRGRHAIG